MPAQRLALQAVTHQSKQSVESLAHVRSTHCQINPRRRSQSKHRLRLFQHGQQALQRRHIKPPRHFDPPSSRHDDRQATDHRAQWQIR